MGSWLGWIGEEIGGIMSGAGEMMMTELGIGVGGQLRLNTGVMIEGSFPNSQMTSLAGAWNCPIKCMIMAVWAHVRDWLLYRSGCTPLMCIASST